MSQDNVETIRRGLEAWNAGNMDALRALYDPGVIVRAAEGWPEPGPYVGRDGVMRQWESARAAFNADAVEVASEYIDVGDRVAVRIIWRGSGTGPEAGIEWTALFTVRNGKILATEFFWDHSDALIALGSEEW